MESANLITFHLNMDKTIKNILKDGKLDKHDIPQLVLLVSDIILNSASSTKTKVTPEMLTEQMGDMYDYLMAHYNLFPDNEEDKAAYKGLFDVSVELLVYNPQVMKSVNSCFPCFFRTKEAKIN